MTAPQLREGIPSNLLLFENDITQSAISDFKYIDHYPMSQLSASSTGPIEFQINSSSTEYVDMSRTLLKITARILKADSSALPSTDKTTPVNMLMHSLFSQVDIFVQGKLISGGSATYGYQSYIQRLLNTSSDSKDTQLTAELFFKDTAGYFDSVDPGGDNQGLYSRHELSKMSKKVDMIGPLLQSPAQMNRLILNGVTINIKLYRQRPAFCLMSATPTPNYIISISEAVLQVCKVTVNPAILIAHAKALESTNAIYPYIACDCKTNNIASGQSSFSWENLYPSLLPDKIVVGFVSGTAGAGDYKKNPYRFFHYDISSIGVTINNNNTPSVPYKIDITPAQGSTYIDAFYSLFTILGKRDPFGNGIPREDWPDGFALFAFDLRPNFPNSVLMNTAGAVRLNVNFSKPLTEPVQCVLFSQRDDKFEIDKTRNVIV